MDQQIIGEVEFVSIAAIVFRANGEVEDHGVVSFTHRDGLTWKEYQQRLAQQAAPEEQQEDANG